jgi:putative addiction module component (TIGR02574 family)
MSQAVSNIADEILKAELTVSQRLDLISQLWDSIPDSLEGLPIPEWHKDEIDRRLEDADANPREGLPWEQVKKRLFEKQ